MPVKNYLCTGRRIKLPRQVETSNTLYDPLLSIGSGTTTAHTILLKLLDSTIDEVSLFVIVICSKTLRILYFYKNKYRFLWFLVFPVVETRCRVDHSPCRS